MSVIEYFITDKTRRQKTEFVMQVLRTGSSLLAATTLACHYLIK